MKRFTETTKWRDPWFRRLSPVSKLLWLYLIDNCSCIGLIEIDPDAAEFDIGHKIGDKHMTELGDRIQALGDGKYFIPKFICFQYGELSETCPAHKPVFKAIQQHQITRDTVGYKYPSDRVSNTLQEKDKEGEKDKDCTEGVQGEMPIRTKFASKFQKPSSEELGLHASKIGLPASEVVRFQNYYEANGWRVGRNPMKSWSHAMQNWKINFDSNRGSIQNGSSQPGQRPPSIMDLKSVLAAKESLVASLKSKYCTEGPMDITWDDEEKRLEFVKLRREIKEITTRISQMV